MATLQKDRILQFRGQDLCDRDGDKIGSIDEIYLDAETDEPEWALVNTGLFGAKSTFVPLRDASEADGTLSVPFEKATVKDAPKIDPDGQLSQREEAELYRYYGSEYSEGGAGGRGHRDRESGGTARRDTSETETGEAMTRSEEELTVGKTERETGRVRLKKYVVTEDVQKTVPVRREKVRVEREPITDENIDEAASGAEISEAEHEVTLKQEEPVVEKRTVPKERVRLEKDVEHDEREVSDEVRKERIEVDENRAGGVGPARHEE
jgi:uncharacterized protein (TIGR02271 family)